ncbi:MAG: ATP-binding cassette domain-containing protein [Eubacteriaceae bacterium]|nr:ATP-binding cassette domain-containing protein [Eubacteriaceae bacterium]
MSHTDFAVSVEGASKIFIQRQRSKNLLSSLLRPEKKEIKALDNVSFSIAKGEFAAYAGPNGAGKSTTMKILAGMLQPTQGSVSILGMNPAKDRIAIMRKLGILLANRTELWWDHPISQSFEWKKAVWDIPSNIYKQNLEMASELLGIGSLLGAFARELSLGQRMRADLAMMLLHSPEVILLDEPTIGLDIVAKRQMIDFLKLINKEKAATIFVTSHDMDDLEEMAQRVLMLSDGKIAYDGSFEGLRAITGSPTRLTVAMEAGFSLCLDGAELVSVENNVYVFGLDAEKLPINSLMQQLSNAHGVKDVEIRKAPIEQVIAGLYAEWE